jgi:hypothetical protein
MNEEDPRVRFDWTINFGQLLTLLAMVASVVTAYYMLKGEIANHEYRLTAMERFTLEQIKLNGENTNSLGEIKTGVAVIKDRLERNAVGGPKP